MRHFYLEWTENREIDELQHAEQHENNIRTTFCVIFSGPIFTVTFDMAKKTVKMRPEKNTQNVVLVLLF